ncbi:hydroxyphenylacetyl-CoA thioesterase PaaI [uncultured Roseobacter sp.]|uniref:hydroxyphenylacetyl-CoA thioesterase PaaI n=1 Tax=uncultured Roseobacter sp. TaxID=114847 RepID=UPI00262A7204|nr:hydroxyphenylacetyl-CoA thioesterase PaaI [uncultured Roseobacter sp.]
MTPQMRAETCARLMLEKDTASRALGMTIDDIAPGTARLRMPVTDQMANGHGVCHGGYIFTLADSAFAFACNSYNRVTVAQQNQITYLAPGNVGDMLTASAREVSRTGRSGIYDVEVHNQNDDVIAVFRGLSRTIKGQHFPEDGGSE